MATQIRDLKAAFTKYDVEIQTELFSECLRICATATLSFEEFARELDAFCLKKNVEEPDEKLLAKFAADLRAKSPQKRKRESLSSKKPTRSDRNFSDSNRFTPVPKTRGLAFNSRTPTPTKYTAATIGNLTRQTPQRSSASSFESTFNLSTPIKTPARPSFSSPSPFSMKSPANERYTSRKDVGKIYPTYNPNVPSFPKLPPGTYQPSRDFEQISASMEPAEFRFMNESLQDRHDALQRRIDRLSELLLEKLNSERKSNEMVVDEKTNDENEDLEEIQFSSVTSSSQQSAYFIGFVLTDGEGRLSAETCMLQGDERISFGGQAKLEFIVESYHSLFPGQIIGVKGVCDGRTIVVEKIFDDFRPKTYPMTPKERVDFHLSDELPPLSLLVATGPYHTKDNLDYDGSALKDFAAVVKREQPHAVILVGPFVSIHNDLVSKGKMSKTFKEAFDDLLDQFFLDIGDNGLVILLIPSLLDAQHYFVFPQPKFDYAYRPEFNASISAPENRVWCLPNPAQFRIDDVVFAIGSQDIIRDLSSSDAPIPSRSAMNDAKLPRWQVLTEHLIKQQSMSPLYPGGDESNIDFTFYEHLNLKFCPDLLFWTSPSSKISTINAGTYELCDRSSLGIFPGQLINNSGAAGRYASVTVQRLTRQQCELNSDGNFRERPPTVADRTRVDIIRI